MKNILCRNIFGSKNYFDPKIFVQENIGSNKSLAQKVWETCPKRLLYYAKSGVWVPNFIPLVPFLLWQIRWGFLLLLFLLSLFWKVKSTPSPRTHSDHFDNHADPTGKDTGLYRIIQDWTMFIWAKCLWIRQSVNLWISTTLSCLRS